MPLLQISYKHTYQRIDRGFLESFGPHGIGYELYSRSITYSIFTLDFVFRRLFIFLSGLLRFLSYVNN